MGTSGGMSMTIFLQTLMKMLPHPLLTCLGWNEGESLSLQNLMSLERMMELWKRYRFASNPTPWNGFPMCVKGDTLDHNIPHFGF